MKINNFIMTAAIMTLMSTSSALACGDKKKEASNKKDSYSVVKTSKNSGHTCKNQSCSHGDKKAEGKVASRDEKSE